jgi:hypothetical protein
MTCGFAFRHEGGGPSRLSHAAFTCRRMLDGATPVSRSAMTASSEPAFRSWRSETPGVGHVVPDDLAERLSGMLDAGFPSREDLLAGRLEGARRRGLSSAARGRVEIVGEVRGVAVPHGAFIPLLSPRRYGRPLGCRGRAGGAIPPAHYPVIQSAP